MTINGFIISPSQPGPFRSCMRMWVSVWLKMVPAPENTITIIIANELAICVLGAFINSIIGRIVQLYTTTNRTMCVEMLSIEMLFRFGIIAYANRFSVCWMTNARRTMQKTTRLNSNIEMLNALLCRIRIALRGWMRWTRPLRPCKSSKAYESYFGVEHNDGECGECEWQRFALHLVNISFKLAGIVLYF